MNARRKLNAANINGIAVIATLLGMLSESLTVGCIAAGTLTFSAFASGGIRGPRPDRRKPDERRVAKLSADKPKPVKRLFHVSHDDT